MSNFPKRLTVKVDVNKILKDKLYQGQKGTYLDLVLFNTPDNAFGDDFVVKQDLGKEAREQGLESPILGNAKAWALGEGQPCKREDGPSFTIGPAVPPKSGSDDLPF